MTSNLKDSPADSDHLGELSRVLLQAAGQLRGNRGRLREPARSTAQAMAQIIEDSHGLQAGEPALPADLLGQALAASQVVAPAGHNGLGDTVIWEALRRSGRSVECEEWTRVTNEVRMTRLALLDAAAAARETEAKAAQRSERQNG